MRVAVVSSNECSGGAARAAFRLIDGLRRNGIEVDHYVERKDRGGSPAILYTAGGALGGLAQDVLARAGAAGAPAWRRRRRTRAQRALRGLLAGGRYDVINVHGFNEWADPGLERGFIAGLAGVAPVVWTLHDLWPLSGCCDYAADCRRVPPCGGRGDKGAREEVARWIAQGERTAAVAPSQWMADRAREAWGPQVRVEVIPYGVDTAVFRPLDRRFARDALGLPKEGRLLLAVADRLAAPRKGLSLALDALQQLPPEVGLILVGLPGSDVASLPRVHPLGLIADERLLAQAYAASDVVVVPSLEDNLPNVLLEALACGRPLAGFRIGGVPDAIDPGRSGELADRTDAAALADAVRRALGWCAQAEAACRGRAERDYPLARQAHAYEALFAGLARASA